MTDSTRLTPGRLGVRLAHGWRAFVSTVAVLFKTLYDTPPGC